MFSLVFRISYCVLHYLIIDIFYNLGFLLSLWTVKKHSDIKNQVFHKIVSNIKKITWHLKKSYWKIN